MIQASPGRRGSTRVPRQCTATIAQRVVRRLICSTARTEPDTKKRLTAAAPATEMVRASRPNTLNLRFKSLRTLMVVPYGEQSECREWRAVPDHKMREMLLNQPDGNELQAP